MDSNVAYRKLEELEELGVASCLFRMPTPDQGVIVFTSCVGRCHVSDFGCHASWAMGTCLGLTAPLGVKAHATLPHVVNPTTRRSSTRRVAHGNGNKLSGGVL